jgi:chromosome segregation ATPase
MRDGPPSPSETMSSDDLMHEIADLRSRLTEMDDDGRSSVCESMNDIDLVFALRKDVARLADEKAKQEKEFMNQMSSLGTENQSVIANLKSKLARSRAEADEQGDRAQALSGVEVERNALQRQLKEIQEIHSIEVEQLKENITRADEEISETRQEADYLHQVSEEVRAEKEAMFEQVEAIRLELKNEKRQSESFRVQLKKSEDTAALLRKKVDLKDREWTALREQVGEMNDTMIELEAGKDLAESQLSTVRKELNQTKHKLAFQKAKSTDQGIMTSAEMEGLERSCEQLEERLARTQLKLAEKDTTIEEMTVSLQEEKANSRRIRQELIDDRFEDTNTGLSRSLHEKQDTTGSLSRSLHGSQDTSKEIEFLRRRNKSLSDELLYLKKKVPEGDPGSKVQPSCTPPRIKRTATGGASPRTPVSGLVASFEKRLTRRPDDKHQDVTANTSYASDFSPSSDKSTESKELKEAHRTIQSLELELQEEHETVLSLRKQLLVSSDDRDAVKSLEIQLDLSQEQVTVLQKKVGKMEMTKREYFKEIEQLQYNLDRSKELTGLEEEKKDEERGEEVGRLRSQVEALQSELSDALEQLEDLNEDCSSLQTELEEEKRVSAEYLERMESMKFEVASASKTNALAGKEQKMYDKEITKLKVELTKTQVSKGELEMEYMHRVKEMETEIEAVEIEASEEIDELKSLLMGMQQSLSSKEEHIHRLETEKKQLCNNMSMASRAKHGDFDELQAELLDTTAKSTSQAREIQALKMKIEELDGIKMGKAERLQGRVDELEELIEDLKTAKASSTREDIERVRRENHQLKESIRQVKMERRSLQERVESLVSEKSSSKSVQILRDRNASLKEEVEKMTRRLKKMEESITRFAI